MSGWHYADSHHYQEPPHRHGSDGLGICGGCCEPFPEDELRDCIEDCGAALCADCREAGTHECVEQERGAA